MKKDFDSITENDKLIRRTYYLTEELIQAVALMSVKTNRDKSELIRKALESFIPASYIVEAKEILRNKNEI